MDNHHLCDRIARKPTTKMYNYHTGSHYSGEWDADIKTMDGFGSYMYPDGSEYRGIFKNGKFHGFGQLTLAYPYDFTFQGEFVDGYLEKIHKMYFRDGLHVNAKFDDNAFDTKGWMYCSKHDRRFTNEISHGLSVHNSESNIPLKMVKEPSEYDFEDGVYMEMTGYLNKRREPSTQPIYIAYKKQQDWIKKNAPKFPHPCESLEPNGAVSSEILNLNMKTDVETNANSENKLWNEELTTFTYGIQKNREHKNNAIKPSAIYLRYHNLMADYSIHSTCANQLPKETIQSMYPKEKFKAHL